MLSGHEEADTFVLLRHPKPDTPLIALVQPSERASRQAARTGPILPQATVPVPGVTGQAGFIGYCRRLALDDFHITFPVPTAGRVCVNTSPYKKNN